MDPLRTKYDDVDRTLTDLRQEAGEKWRKLEEARKAYAESDTTDGPLLEALNEAGKTYGEIGDKITAAEKTKRQIVDAMAIGGAPAPDGPKGPGGLPAVTPEQQRQIAKSTGWRITEGEDYKRLIASGDLNSSSPLGKARLGEGMTREEYKAAITGADDTSAGAFLTPDRIGYFPMPLRPLTLVDLITVGDTDGDLVEYVRQTSFTNAAAPVAEATDSIGTSGVKPQSDMRFEIVQTGVKTIAHWVAATRRALSDAGQIRTIIDGLLRYGLDRVLEDQILNGDGTGENLRGILQTTGLNSIAASTRSIADRIHMGITQNLLDGFASTGIVMNPLDWETVRLSRENESTDPPSGAYLFGSPSAVGVETLWGRPVATTAAMPQGTALVGDLRAAILWVREGTQILASDSHENFFVRNLIAILAENRAAFGIPYPQALCEVDLTTPAP